MSGATLLSPIYTGDKKTDRGETCCLQATGCILSSLEPNEQSKVKSVKRTNNYSPFLVIKYLSLNGLESGVLIQYWIALCLQDKATDAWRMES